MQHPGARQGSWKALTTIDHAGALAVRRPDALSAERVAGRALQARGAPL